MKLRKFAFIMVALVSLSGCSALQYARYHTPSLTDDSIRTVPDGDGIAFQLPDICMGIDEGISAYRNPLFIGPLVFTIFPLGIFTPIPTDSNYLWLNIRFKPNVEGFTFAPEKIHTKFKDGLVLSPTAYTVWRYYSPPGPVQFIGTGHIKPIAISMQTVISLRFDKPNTTDQAVSVLIQGLLKDGTMIQVLPVNLHFGSEFRMILPGYSAHNRKVSTFDKSCGALDKVDPLIVNPVQTDNPE